MFIVQVMLSENVPQTKFKLIELTHVLTTGTNFENLQLLMLEEKTSYSVICSKGCAQ